jgi:hypothetical protein
LIEPGPRLRALLADELNGDTVMGVLVARGHLCIARSVDEARKQPLDFLLLPFACPLLLSQRECAILPVGNQHGGAMAQKADRPAGHMGLDRPQDSRCPGTVAGLRDRAAHRADQRRSAGRELRTLYPVPWKLEQEGAIASEGGVSENNRRAHFYRPIREGRHQLQGETQDWEQTAAIIGRFFDVKTEDLS